MTTRSSFFLSAFAAAIAVIGATSVAQAQSTALPGVTVSSTTIAPAPAPIGLMVTGWNMSSGIGQGYNIGGDGKGTANTYADGFFSLGAESFLTGNSNPNCTVDCASTQAKLWIIGSQNTGAHSMNQGVGSQTNPVVSVAGTHGIFNASLQTQWKFTPAPTATPATP